MRDPTTPHPGCGPPISLWHVRRSSTDHGPSLNHHVNDRRSAPNDNHHQGDNNNQGTNFNDNRTQDLGPASREHLLP